MFKNGYWSNLSETMKSFSKDELRNLTYLILAYFGVLFVYPIIRTTAKTYFLQSYSGFETPNVVLFSALANFFVVLMMNKFQDRFNVKKLFSIASFFSMAVFLICLFMIKSENKIFCYFFYIWKESYIVILLHLILGYFNANVHESKAKLIYGPLGAIGSFGGVLGAELLKQTTNTFGVDGLVLLGSGLILFSVLFFNLCDDSKFSRNEETKNQDLTNEKNDPLRSVKGIWKYIALIMMVVGLTQFLVVIAETQLDILLSKNLLDNNNLNILYGSIYQKINIGSTIYGIVLVPFLLTRFNLKIIHFGIIFLYLFLILIGLGIGAHSSFLVSFAFIGIKATDYSLFNAAKELLYFPLNKVQKYGAKYLTDMIFYRLSKGLVAIVLIVFLNDVKKSGDQYISLLNFLNYSTLIVWFIAVYFLFKLKDSYFPKDD
jgi:ATP:ADP antiporter, AAA family